MRKLFDCLACNDVNTGVYQYKCYKYMPRLLQNRLTIRSAEYKSNDNMLFCNVITTKWELMVLARDKNGEMATALGKKERGMIHWQQKRRMDTDGRSDNDMTCHAKVSKWRHHEEVPRTKATFVWKKTPGRPAGRGRVMEEWVVIGGKYVEVAVMK